MNQGVKPQTRLDTVVKLREKDEERARLQLAEAQRAAAAAERAAAAARANAKLDLRGRGSAAEWELTEIGHFAALRAAAVAEKTAHAATEKVAASRNNWGTAYKRAESMRRVADARRAEIVAEQENKERKQLDEIGGQLYLRN